MYVCFVALPYYFHSALCAVIDHRLLCILLQWLNNLWIRSCFVSLLRRRNEKSKSNMVQQPSSKQRANNRRQEWRGIRRLKMIDSRISWTVDGGSLLAILLNNPGYVHFSIPILASSPYSASFPHSTSPYSCTLYDTVLKYLDTLLHSALDVGSHPLLHDAFCTPCLALVLEL